MTNFNTASRAYGLLVGALLTFAAVTGAAAEETIHLGPRSYAVQPPADAEATGAPALVHLHGWGRTAEGVLRNKRVAEAAAEAGAMLIAPQGIGKSWSFWSGDERDVEFIDAVVEDAVRRWSIDRERVYISGFSYGGAMVWRLACARGDAYAAYLPIAGALWRQTTEDCVGPARIHYVHGLKDTVMDPPGEASTQPETMVALWIRENAHANAPDRVETLGRYQRRVWAERGDAPEIVLDLHGGGHFIPKGWLNLALSRLSEEPGI